MNDPNRANEKYLSVVYVSTATEEFDKQALADLLAVSQANNCQVGVTGMLLHHDGSFIQAIEGPPDAVRQLHTRITEDSRHTGIITLLEYEIDEREFGEWQMGFRDLGALDHGERDGYSDLLNSNDLPAGLAGDPARSKKLLLSFRDTIRIN